ncbi:MAG: IclR family transcriptional regulator [Blastocatellia bacterium]
MKEQGALQSQDGGAPEGAAEAKSRYSIEVVAKAFDLLQVFIDEEKDALSLSEIAARVGLNKNAVFRLLVTLTEKGFLVKSPETGKYRLSLKFIELGRVARLSNDLRNVALPRMKELWREFEDTVNLAVLDEGQICYLEVLESPHRFKFVASPGDHDPVHCTALGKAMMARLPVAEVRSILDERGMMTRYTANTITTCAEVEQEFARIRERGYALNEGEMVEASRCVAAPILLRKGEVAGALSVSGTAARIPDNRIPQISQALLRCCAEISRELD